MRLTLAVTAVCVLTFFAGLGRPAIGDSDEAFYAQAAREMVESGDWLTPRYNFAYRFQKPILMYWLIAGTYIAAGVSEAAARFWPAMAGLGLALMTASAARRWYGADIGRLAGLIAATSFGYFVIARLALPDLPLAFFITWAIWGALVAMMDERPGSRRAWLLGSGLALGLGFLIKGPVAVAVPAIVLLPIGLLYPPARRVSAVDMALAALVFLLIAGPWYVAMLTIHGGDYLRGFFIGDNLERFATDRFNEPRPVWFYLPIVAGGMLPWSPFLTLWIPSASRFVTRRSRPGRREACLMLWALMPLVFFTVSIGKQPRYILPMLPPLAILLARTIRQAARGSSLIACAVAAGVLLVSLGLLIYRARPLVAVSAPPTPVLLAAAAVVLSGAMVLAAAFWRRAAALDAAMTGAAVVTLMSLHYGVLSSSTLEPVERMAALVTAHRQGDEPIGGYQVFVRNLVFYTGLEQTDLYDRAQLATFLDRKERVLCVLTEGELSRVEQRDPGRLRRLGEVEYFNTAAVKLRTLLWPDPARDLVKVVLVTNR